MVPLAAAAATMVATLAVAAPPGAVAVSSGAGAPEAGELLVTPRGAEVPRSLQEMAGDEVNALSFVPRRLHSAIREGKDASDLTRYLQAAIDAAKNGRLVIPAGTYHHTGLTTRASIVITGVGWRGTVLANTSSATPSITIASQPGADYLVGGVSISDLQITGTGTGAGVLYDTMSHSVLSRVYILRVGGHGVQLGATQHVYGLTLDNCFIQFVGGDGVHGKGRPSRQVNAINILGNTEITGAQNGVNVWGVSIRVENAIIEGNRGYGVLLTEADALGTEHSAGRSISLEGNYLEGNAQGNIRVEVGHYLNAIAKSLAGLTIRDNYLYGGGMKPGVPNVSMVKVPGLAMKLDRNPYLAGFTFTGNTVVEDPANPSRSSVCDFGDLPGANSVISPGEALNPFGGEKHGGTAVEARYLNLGLARFDLPSRRMTIPGLFHARGEILYSDTTSAHSEPVALSAAPKRAYFPVTLPQGSLLLDAGVHVESASRAYAVEIAILQRDPRGGAGEWAALLTWTAEGQSGSKLLELPDIDAMEGHPARRRIRKGGEDLMLRISVTGAAGSTLRLGNPYVRYN